MFCISFTLLFIERAVPALAAILSFQNFSFAAFLEPPREPPRRKPSPAIHHHWWCGLVGWKMGIVGYLFRAYLIIFVVFLKVA